MNPLGNPRQDNAVVVFGLGYVGCVTAACLAQLGHHVIGVDMDQHKVDAIQQRRSPFFEPGLDELVSNAVAAGTLRATVSAADALRDATIALICVGTPSQRDGNLSIEYLRRVSDEIAQCLSERPAEKPPLIVAVRSTVFPGTCEDVVMPALAKKPAVVIMHPEFMREGSAVRDFRQPPLLVFGGPDKAVLRRVADLYLDINAEPVFVSLRTAEMIKYACNAFHAVKIEFANEVGALCANLGIDGREVMDTVCRDVVLNISSAYLKPGLAFGGSCLPKDLRALVYRSRREDLSLPLLESILPGNEEHLRRGIQAVLDLPSGRIGVFGLAFKENTDDLRESPVVTLLEKLIGKGRDVRVFDPHIQLDQIYGTNRRFILAAVPHIARLLDHSLDGLLGWADYIVVAQKPSAEYMERIQSSGRQILNLMQLPGRESVRATP